jgi:FkbH-like protein
MSAYRPGFSGLWGRLWPLGRDNDLDLLTDSEFIEAIYQRYLGRSADAQGMDHYLRLLTSQRGRSRVLRDIRRSPEARRYAQYRRRRQTITQFLREDQAPLLPTALDRNPRPKPRVALLGTCLAEDLLQVAMGQGWSVRHFLLDSGPHETGPQIAADAFDAVLVHLTLRTILLVVTESGDGDLFHLRPGWDIGTVREKAVAYLNALIQQLLGTIPVGLPVFFLAFLEPPPAMHGIFGQNRGQSLYALVRSLNDALAEILLAQERGHYLEINDIRQYYGDASAYDGCVTHYTHGGLFPASLQGEWIYRDILERLDGALRVLHAEDPVKLIITDLDNTLWRGVLAEEDEIVPLNHTENWPLGYVEALLECKRRGILLSICSKNDEEPTRRRFQQLWGERLRLEDFCTMRINWQPKSQNIVEILRVTNILPDHTLFIDDHPREIDEVRRAFPQMRFLTGKPERWRHVLLYAPETQVARLTEESQQRTESIQAKIARESAAGNMDRESWLHSLDLKLRFDRISESGHPRYARALELLNKTNQFNTTGRRWSDADMQNWLAAEGILIAARAEDRFAQHGLVALALVHAQQIEQFVLSCRVFGLGIETALLAKALQQIQEAGHSVFEAQFTATGRNDTCRDFWPTHGFTQDAESVVWRSSVMPDIPAWIRLESE